MPRPSLVTQNISSESSHSELRKQVLHGEEAWPTSPKQPTQPRARRGDLVPSPEPLHDTARLPSVPRFVPEAGDGINALKSSGRELTLKCNI